MRIIFGFILTFIYFATIVIEYKRTNDIFSPICFYSILRSIYVLPGIYTEISLFYHYSSDDLFLFFLIEVISLFLVIMGKKFYNKIQRKDILYKIDGNYMGHLNRFGIVLFSLGSFSVIYLILKSGGISFIFANIDLRVFLLRGQGYLSLLGNLVNIGILCYLVYWAKNKKKVSVFLVLVSLITFGSLTKLAFGARTPLLILLMGIVMTYNYSIKRINFRNLLSIKSASLLIVLSLFVVMFPMIRNAETRSLYLMPKVWVAEGLKTLTNVASEFSTVDRDMFVIDNFNLSNFWFGRSYIDLIYAPIPSNLLPDKPPVDDGVYLANMILGYDIRPSTAFEAIPFKSSVPFTSFGIFYANAGVVGVILGMFIMGIIYQFTYRILRDTNYNVFMIVVYQMVIYTFKPSNLGIAQTMQVIALAWLSFRIFGGMKINRIKLTKARL